MMASCMFAAGIDFDEGYHVPASFDKILITNSDGTAIQNTVDYIQSGSTISLLGDFNLKMSININKKSHAKSRQKAEE